MKIKWTNKFSGETGYVKCLKKKDKYFENTYDITEARNFASNQTKSTIGWLREVTPDNTYKVVDNDDIESLS